MSNIQKTKENKPTIYQMINGQLGAIKKAIPKHMTPERLLRIVVTEVRKTPKLAECNPASLLGALMMSAQLGLEPSVLGHCYLIPYGKNVQFQIGYKGMLELTRNSGEVSHVKAEVVREKDFFEYELGLNPILKHIPAYGKDRGKIIHFYSYAVLKDGEKPFLIMDDSEIQKIMKCAPSHKKPDSPWIKWYEEMGKAKIIKRFTKLLPLSVDRQRHISQDETIKSVDFNQPEIQILDQPDENTYEAEIIEDRKDVPEEEVRPDDNKALESLSKEMWDKYKTKEVIAIHLKRLSKYTPKGKNQKEAFVEDLNKLSKKPEWAQTILGKFRKENNPDAE